MSTRLAIRESAIIVAEKVPKLANSPIGEVAMTAKPAMSEAAEPTSAAPQAPPTACSAALCDAPSFRDVNAVIDANAQGDGGDGDGDDVEAGSCQMHQAVQPHHHHQDRPKGHGGLSW